MRQVTTILITLCLLSGLSGCDRDDGMSVTKYSQDTDKYYEETADGYKAALYMLDEIDNGHILNWLDGCGLSDGYHQYIYSDPDSWDMYILYRPEGPVYSYSMRFKVDGTVVMVYLTTGSPAQGSDGAVLVRIQAPLRGSWPTESRLYIDGAPKELTSSTSY